MKKELKKTGTLLLIAVLSLSFVLSGCGSKAPASADTGSPAASPVSTPAASAATEEATPEASAEATPAPKPGGTIVMWGWDTIQKNVDLIMPEFQKEYPEIKVQFETIPAGDLYQKMILALSSGEGAPDVACYESSNLAQAVYTGGLTDLTGKATPYLDKIVDSKWAEATMDGKIYAMPWDIGPVGLYYRRDIFGQAGLASTPDEVAKLLHTWDDYYNTAKIIKEKTGVAMFSESQEKSTARTFQELLWQQGAWYTDANGKPDFTKPEIVGAMTFMSKMVKEGLTDNTEEWTQAWYDGFSQGRVATAIGAVWLGGFLSGWIAPDTAGKWGVVPLPVWKEGGARTSNDGGSNFVIPKQTKNFDAAWAFVEFYLGRTGPQLEMYKASDIFPGLKECYSDPMFSEAMDFYGGQQARKLFAELAPEVPVVTYGKDYQMMNDAMATVMQKVYLNNEDIATALQEAQDEVGAKMDN